MRKHRLRTFLLLFPILFLLGLFLLGLASGIVQSFGVIPSLGLDTPTLRYYQELLKNPGFWQSARYSLYLSLVSSLLAVIGGIILCFSMVRTDRQKHSKLLGLLQIPILVPHVAVALFVMSLFSQTGLLSRILHAMGLLQSQNQFPSVLYDPGGVGIILAYLWKEIPFVAFFTVTLMASVNENLGETAQNLGASPTQAFFRVILPVCAPAIRNAFLIILAFSFGAYELPFLLGPTTPKALPVAAYLEYLSPDLRNRPRAMALNTVMLAISLGMAWAYYLLIRRQTRSAERKGRK